MNEYRFYIPLVRDSDREPHNCVVWDWLEHLLVREFGGFTRGPDVYGCWQETPDCPITGDHNATYYVATRGVVTKLVNVLTECCKQFDQKCIYCVKTSSCVECITP